MDQSTSETPGASPQIVLAADARPVASAQARPPSRLPLILATLALAASLGALGTTLWMTAQGNREILRLSTELAQLRVSLDLYARSGSANTASGAEGLATLTERLDALERAAETASVPLPAASEASVPAVTAEGEDCLPPGMRLLVAMGDRYPICGQNAVVEVSMIDNGYIKLADGTTIPSGGTMPLAPGACTIGVTSSGDEGLTGYAEIRVSC